MRISDWSSDVCSSDLKANWTENGKPATLPKDYYSSRVVVQRMIDYIEADRKSGKPFPASINFLANHIPVQAPDSHIARSSAKYRDGWTALRQARAKRAAALGLLPAGAPMATIPPPHHRQTLPAHNHPAATPRRQAY